MWSRTPLFVMLNNHLQNYPTPVNLDWSWNWGSLAGVCLVAQIVTGIFLAMSYNVGTPYAAEGPFEAVQHILREVAGGLWTRVAHQNCATLFFLAMYVHMWRSIRQSSQTKPREVLWLIGVVILLVAFITAFLGYVLPWGLNFGPTCIIFNVIDFIKLNGSYFLLKLKIFNSSEVVLCCVISNIKKNKQLYKIMGPHNIDFLSLLFGSLLGDGAAEYRSGSTRFRLKQSSIHAEYLGWFHSFLASRGYCNPDKPVLKKTIGKGNKVYFYARVSTYSSSSFNWLYQAFYNGPNNKKMVPSNEMLDMYLTPLALAVWIMDDGAACKNGMLLCTYCFTPEDVNRLCNFLESKYGLKCINRITPNGPLIYITKASMSKLRFLVLPLMVPSMHYKLN